jgi:restriction system protein
MSAPDFQTMLRPILELFAEGKTNVRDCIAPLKERLNISDEDAEETLPSGQTVLYNRAHWARTYLGKAGLLESPKRGTHLITPAGKAFLKTAPARITIPDLRSFSSFNDWQARDQGDAKQSVSDIDPEVANPQTPEDQIQSAHKVINSALRDDLLTALLQMSPARFERVILDLLQAMGFGGGKSEFRRLTPATNDGGIDGIINEDALGLDAVYVQAKRYASENKVSRPDIQRFVGSLTGESATKGVFVTTSEFSREAVAYVDRIQQRVVLLNGQSLAQFMIDYDVGVRTRAVVKVKSLDEDYFIEK